MLIELQQMASSLSRLKINPPALHPWVKPLEKGSFWIVNLNSEGNVASADWRTAEDGLQLSKIVKDNQNSFPAVKVNSPIWSVDAKHECREQVANKNRTAVERAAILDRICSDAHFQADHGTRQRLKMRIQVFARELAPLFQPYASDAPALISLLNAIAGRELDIDTFLKQLTVAVINAVREGADVASAVQLLIGTVKKSGEIDEKKITIVLDWQRGKDQTIRRVAHPFTANIYHRVLLAQSDGGALGVCALTGLTTEIEAVKLPSPKLPELNETILLSMNPDTPCHLRYGRIGAGVYPIGKPAVKELSSALLWMTHGDRKGKTWSLVPRNKDSKRDLVIAYIEQMPEIDIELADMFGDMHGAALESIFEQHAKTLIAALEDGRGPLSKDFIVHTIVLRRVSKGQVQVEYSREYRMGRLAEAIREWRRASANLPEICFPIPAAKGQPAIEHTTAAPRPAAVVRATRAAWIRGTEKQAVVGLPVSTAYDLFLGQPAVARAAAQHVIETLISRTEPLLVHCGPGAITQVPVPARYDALTAVVILGIALYKMDRFKEVYMNDSAFLIGRMLALADVLHASYCTVVRNQQLPPQLLGNQLYASVTLNAKQGFGVLGERLRVYKAWADTAQVAGGGDNSDANSKAIRIAKWALARMAECANGLAGQLRDGAMADAEKAELLLGYLSRGSSSHAGAEKEMEKETVNA